MHLLAIAIEWPNPLTMSITSPLMVSLPHPAQGKSLLATIQGNRIWIASYPSFLRKQE